MRVLMVTGSFPPMKCGVGDYTASLVRALAGTPGVDVAVLTDRQAVLREPGEPYSVFPVIDKWRRHEFPKVEAVIREFKPDIVHLQYPTLGYRNKLPWLLPTFLVKVWVPVVQTWHEHYIGRDWREIALTVSRGGIIVVRPHYLDALPWWYRAILFHKRFQFIPAAASIPKADLSEEARRALRSSLAPPGKALVVFFGFFYDHKGIDDLLLAVDPARHHLLLVGQSNPDNRYEEELLARISREPFSTYVTSRRDLPASDVAEVLSVADAVALPYRHGGGIWNSSLQAAMLQGVFTLTTSFERRGYDSAQNVYYAEPGNIAEIRSGLERYLGQRNRNTKPQPWQATWDRVAGDHLKFYRRYARLR